MTPTARRAARTTMAFAVWTLLTWATRIDNVWRDDSVSTGGKVGRTALAGSFVVFGLVTLASSWRDRHRRSHPRITYRLVLPFAAWTVAVWVVRSVGIVTNDHSTAFVVVHLVLATVSIGLAVLTVTRLRRALGEPDVEGERQAPAAPAGLEELVDG